MAGLIPLGGGDGAPPWPTCFRCDEPAVGPCAMCRVMICASDDCSMIVYESGLREVVLCRDCARFRPVLSSRPWTAPLLALAGLAVGAWVVWQVAAGQISWLQTASGVLSLALLLLACASALARWQWRARLASARERREFH